MRHWRLTSCPKMEGFTGAYIRANNPDFIYDLAKKYMLTITPQGRDPIMTSLDGTNDAFKALRTCRECGVTNPQRPLGPR